MSKIPSTCCYCREPLRVADMEHWVATCLLHRLDPVQQAKDRSPPGVPCGACTVRLFAEAYHEGHPAARKSVARLAARERWGAVRVLPGGKA